MVLPNDDSLLPIAANDHHQAIIEGLVQHGWAVIPGFFSATLSQQLLDELMLRRDREDLTRAGIGREQDHHQNDLVRRDLTHWLDGSTLAQCRYLEAMEALRLCINRELFLGLFDFEAHFALYEPGAFYRKHLDAFKGESRRVVSVVAYLNPAWQEADGACLNLFDPKSDQVIYQVLPEAGTLVCFLSEDIPHEVTAARRDRGSIAGWFRRNASIGGIVDPAS